MKHAVSDVERARRAVGRAGFAVAASGLVAAMFLQLAGLAEASSLIFQITFAVLLLMPVKNVLAIFAEEVRRRDWWFVLLAAAVVAELALNAWDRLR